MKANFLFLVLILFNAQCSFLDNNIEQKVIFEEANGLMVGSSVLLNGFPIGHVKSIKLNESYKIEATLSLYKDSKLPSNSRFILNQELLGGANIQVKPGLEKSFLNGSQIIYGESINHKLDSNNLVKSPVKGLLKSLFGNDKQDSIFQELKRLNQRIERLEKKVQ